ncbi:hypothetical protein [Ralstonia pseudosolanacearum]|uniref:hypothetical protein n=1 Tax=Ralstonia pseudosolanacearum TaxID=1310165 RepID=UPI0007F050A2|nr:hypothetical protein [Ralstonia pseudosolanacearum]ANH31784.1 hypothetical protein A3768_0607 [Ralstonia solanacearum]
MKYLEHMRASKCAWLDLAVDSKKATAGLLRHARFALFDCYREFDGIIDRYKDRPAASRSDLIASVLKDFYVAPPNDLHEQLTVRRHKHDLDECPYCGYPLPPKTLDHFLPKEDWPEYAIFSNNLVPQCNDCAPIKGQRYYCNTRDQALFLHPMYSSALSTVRFYIEVSLVGGEPAFKPAFSILEHASKEDEERVELHLKSLHVRRRIVDYCKEQYRRWIRIVSRKGCDIRASFKTRLKEKELDRYADNWGIAFYQGVLRSPEVVENLQSWAPHGPPRPPEKVRPLSIED